MIWKMEESVQQREDAGINCYPQKKEDSINTLELQSSKDWHFKLKLMQQTNQKKHIPSIVCMYRKMTLIIK